MTVHPYIADRSIPEPNCGCLLWEGCVNEHGYGTATVEGRQRRAHRISYALHRGTVPAGLHVLHKCDVPSCVNPDHLFLGTHLDNMADRGRKGRAARQVGEGHGRSKLTADQVKAIFRSGGPAAAVGRAHGVSKETVKDIRHGRRWAHLNLIGAAK